VGAAKLSWRSRDSQTNSLHQHLHVFAIASAVPPPSVATPRGSELGGSDLVPDPSYSLGSDQRISRGSAEVRLASCST